MEIKWIKLGALAAVFCLVVKYSGEIFRAGGLVLGTIRPLLFGCVLAYVLNIFMKKLEKIYFPKRTEIWVTRTRRPVCVTVSVVSVLLLAVFFFGMIIPALGECIHILTRDLPGFFGEVQRWLIQVLQDTPELQEYVEGLEIDWAQLTRKAGELLGQGLEGLFNSAFSAANMVISGIATLVIATIFAIYLLFQKERLKGQVRKTAEAYLPEYPRRKAEEFLGLAHETFTSFITGQLTEACIIGVLCTAGMMVLRLPYAQITGMTVGVTALIPVMGAYMGAALGAFMIMTQSPVQALIFLVFLVILQQVEGNLIYPRVVGGSIGLPALWVLASVTLGGGLFGIPGMLLGVPLTATLYKWFRMAVNEKLARKSGPYRSDNPV